MAKLFMIGKDVFPEGMVEYLAPRLAELGVHLVEINDDNGDPMVFFADEKVGPEVAQEAYCHADQSEELASGRIVDTEDPAWK